MNNLFIYRLIRLQDHGNNEGQATDNQSGGSRRVSIDGGKVTHASERGRNLRGDVTEGGGDLRGDELRGDITEGGGDLRSRKVGGNVIDQTAEHVEKRGDTLIFSSGGGGHEGNNNNKGKEEDTH